MAEGDKHGLTCAVNSFLPARRRTNALVAIVLHLSGRLP